MFDAFVYVVLNISIGPWSGFRLQLLSRRPTPSSISGWSLPYLSLPVLGVMVGSEYSAFLLQS